MAQLTLAQKGDRAFSITTWLNLGYWHYSAEWVRTIPVRVSCTEEDNSIGTRVIGLKQSSPSPPGSDDCGRLRLFSEIPSAAV